MWCWYMVKNLDGNGGRSTYISKGLEEKWGRTSSDKGIDGVTEIFGETRVHS